MVSRRRILSQSRDELHSDIYYTMQQMQDEEDSDVWYSKQKLYQDHMQEVNEKWQSIDDEIWAKIIILERNRRVAKAYARAPVLTINGSDDGFDGFRIGLAGFENPMRNSDADEIIRQIGSGFKLKMDNVGNILIKRLSKNVVRVGNLKGESAVSNDILKLPGSVLEVDKPFKIFDMQKFQQNFGREIKRAHPDISKLEAQCICTVSFGNSDSEVKGFTEIGLNSPIWILIINIVAVEMLRSKLPPSNSSITSNSFSSSKAFRRNRSQSTDDFRAANRYINGPGISGPFTSLRPIFGSGSSDEDPYSVAGSGSSGGSSGNMPPKLPPPRDTAIYGPKFWTKTTLIGSDQKKCKTSNVKSLSKDLANQDVQAVDRKNRGDDPYYCGLRARIPNFVKSRKKKSKGNETHSIPIVTSSPVTTNSSGTQPFWWHNRIYNEGLTPSGGKNERNQSDPRIKRQLAICDSSDSDYSHIYGRLPMASRVSRKFQLKPLPIGQWD